MPAEELKLLPCPFCGCGVELEKEYHEKHPCGGKIYFWIRCDCGIQTPGRFDDAKAEIAYWNRRAEIADKIANGLTTTAATPCDHVFVGNDYLCKKCGLYFPETSG